MKVLVATLEDQGEREGDFAWVPEGELVYPHFVCDRDRRAAAEGRLQDGCGCGRAMAGLVSHKSITTVKVVEVNYDRRELYKQVCRGLTSAGWGGDLAAGVIETIEDLVEGWPPGTVLGRAVDEVFVRKLPDEA